MDLRPYQNDFIQSVATGFNSGFMRQLGVLPTGGGKTIVFAKIAQRFHERRNERTLVLAHREELIEQAADKIEKATGIKASIEKAERQAYRESPIVVASIQTMQRDRLASWPCDHFGLVVCDEAHHVLADQWRATLDHFSSRVLGVTATPDRGDKRKLSEYFENLAYETNILQLIQDGYLADVKVKAVPLEIDLAGVKTTAGDFDSNALDAAIAPYLKQIAKYIADNCRTRKIAAFLPLISTSKRFVEECQSFGLSSAHIDGGSPDRKEILSDYSSGKYSVLSNAMLLTEGWDEPSVDCVLVLRPTRSRSLYAQMVGRGTRLHPGKKDLLLLDFLWLHERHDLSRPASLVAKDKDEQNAITKILLADDGAEKSLDEAVNDAAADREAALIRQIAENAARKERFIRLEEVGALLKDKKIREYSPIFGWEKQAPTQKQIDCLARFKLSCETKGEASMVMNRLFDRSRQKLATVAQLRWLVRYGYPEPEKATAADAKKFLDSKWKR
jgi:superfamily II DNA or RNA helicase